MADITTQVTDAPKVIMSKPIMAIVIMAIGMVLVLIIEAYKPGIITGPIRKGLGMVGIG